jgi:hypothetical protein
MSKKKELRNSRSLDEFAAEIVAHQRSNIFELGKILREAKEQHDGGFLDWLHENEEDFGFGVDTAENYMAASRLAERFRNIRNLNVGKTTIYALVAFDRDHPELTEIAINTLLAQARGARLRRADAERIVDLVRLRAKFGSHPDATLDGLEDIATTKRPQPWHGKTAEALKAKSPTTEEGAEAVILGVLQEHVEGLYGRAPPALKKEEARNVLEGLARVPEVDRARVLGRLTEPVTEAMVCAAMDATTADGGDAGGAWDEPAMLTRKRERRERSMSRPEQETAPAAAIEETKRTAVKSDPVARLVILFEELSPEEKGRFLEKAGLKYSDESEIAQSAPAPFTNSAKNSGTATKAESIKPARQSIDHSTTQVSP